MLISSATLRGGCPVCRAPQCSCGTRSEAVPVDERMEVAAVGGPLKKYEVTTPHGVKTTMKLDEADAKRLGVFEEPDHDSAEAGSEDEQPAAKKRAVSNKARTAASKGGAGGGDD